MGLKLKICVCPAQHGTRKQVNASKQGLQSVGMETDTSSFAAHLRIYARNVSETEPVPTRPTGPRLRQRGGCEAHSHSHLSWCVSRSSAMTQRTRVLPWRWYRLVSGEYFSTYSTGQGGWGQLERAWRTEEKNNCSLMVLPVRQK